MDPFQVNVSVVINIIMGIIASGSSIIAYFAKKHYADIDKKLEELEGSEKIFTERIHQLALSQARSENLAVTIAELKMDIKDLHKAVHDLHVSLGRVSIPDIRHIK